MGRESQEKVKMEGREETDDEESAAVPPTGLVAPQQHSHPRVIVMHRLYKLKQHTMITRMLALIS